MNASVLTKQQYKSFGPRAISGYAKGAAIYCHVRFDDKCGNGHNTFAITGTVREPGQSDIAAGGCIHEDIAKAFPELAKYIKWHLCSTDGPLHYPANAIYLAGDRDCNGRRKGDVSRTEEFIRFGNSPVSNPVKHSFAKFLKERYGTGDFTVIGFDHDRDVKTYGTHYTLAGYGERWHECPFRTKIEADEFCQGLNTCDVQFITHPTAYSDGKERELDSARSCAIWPEATDEELMADDLKDRLMERLPALLEEFQSAMEELGFTW